MFKNYFKTAIRNLAKNKFFATINIFALALGMSISLIFIATLLFILRYDNFHSKKDRIYRVITHVRDNEDNPSYASAPVGLAPMLQQDVAGLEEVIRINGSLYGNAVRGSSKIPVEGYFADQGFMRMFDFPLAQGDASSALVKPNSIILKKETATKLFGTKDPLGEVFTMEPFGELTVTGVLGEVPANSHLYFDAVVSYETLISKFGSKFTEGEENWTKFINSYVYFVVSENASREAVVQYLNRTANEKYKLAGFRASFELQKLEEIVPGPHLNNSIGPSWDYVSLTLVGLITLVILIPACANYITLAISQSLRRMKEIGVRKVMGGLKKQIFLQFVTETMITMLLALVLSYFFFELIRGEAKEYMGETGYLDMSPTFMTFIGFILFALFVGLIAGIVPALYFAKVGPISALKGESKIKRGGFPLKKIVMTTQFILSLGFIMAVIIVLRQHHYSTNYTLGFEQQNLLDVELQGTNPQLLKNEFGKLPAVQSISLSSRPLGIGSNKEYVKINDYQDSLEASFVSIDENFITNLKLELLRGQNYTDNHQANERFIIINEEFAKTLGKGDAFSAMDQIVKLFDGREVRIGGIIRNFHYDDLRSQIKNFYFEYKPEDFRFANIKMPSQDLAHTTRMAVSWRKINPDEPFQAQFLSDEISDAYKFYFEIIKLWSFLGLLAITVACLGLLGTVVFTIRTRVKEISLRKVMGASSESLVVLLSKDFVILMIIASFITVPVIYFLFDHILTNSQYYRMDIGVVEVLTSVFILFTLGLATILSQTLRASNMNPVDNLRVE